MEKMLMVPLTRIEMWHVNQTTPQIDICNQGNYGWREKIQSQLPASLKKKQGIDYNEIYSPVSLIRNLCVLASLWAWEWVVTLVHSEQSIF